MKTIQLLEISAEPNFPIEIEENIIEYFEDKIRSSDTYVRYYPNNPIEGLNEWLIDNGLHFDIEDRFFYILIRIDW